LSSLEGVRVTVAGASGFVGTNLIPELLSAGARVKGITHSRPPQVAGLDVDFVSADLTTIEGCKSAAKDTDIFVMSAANSSGAQVMASKPLTHLTPNIVMNALTLEAAYEAGVAKYCFISSNTVYPPGEDAMSEDDVTGEFFPSYKIVAGMKLYSEQMVKHYSSLSSSPMSTLVVRPANLYGPFDKFSATESKVIPALIRRAVQREEPFVVWGDGSDVKDFLYISDFVKGLVKSLTLEENCETINLASGVSVALRDVVPLVLESADYGSAKLKFDSTKPSMIPVRRISISKARERLGWKPAVGIEEGIQRTVEWFKGHGLLHE
jgi:GDP-L-fucose synthase